MDVLYFLKEEYAALKERIPAFVGGDLSLNEAELRQFLKCLELVIRVADDLILPELSENAKRGLEALAEAGDQTTDLAKFAQLALKSGRVGESRKREISARLTSHIEHMEHVVLPMFRVEIPTQAREDLGLVAMDFKADALPRAKASEVSAAVQ